MSLETLEPKEKASPEEVKDLDLAARFFAKKQERKNTPDLLIAQLVLLDFNLPATDTERVFSACKKILRDTASHEKRVDSYEKE